MTNILKIDHEKNQIIMDRTFQKKQSNTTSKEFKHLQRVRQDFPEYSIVVKRIARNPSKESYKGLTYEYMERYIMAHSNANEQIAKFMELRFNSECHSIRYPTIKKWFLKEYPEIAEFHLNVA